MPLASAADGSTFGRNATYGKHWWIAILASDACYLNSQPCTHMYQGFQSREWGGRGEVGSMV